jgi:hypothetical protein
MGAFFLCIKRSAILILIVAEMTRSPLMILCNIIKFRQQRAGYRLVLFILQNQVVHPSCSTWVVPLPILLRWAGALPLLTSKPPLLMAWLHPCISLQNCRGIEFKWGRHEIKGNCNIIDIQSPSPGLKLRSINRSYAQHYLSPLYNLHSLVARCYKESSLISCYFLCPYSIRAKFCNEFSSLKTGSGLNVDSASVQ